MAEVQAERSAADRRIEDLVACEWGRFSTCDFRGRPDAPEFEIVEGDLPVLISAPHAVTHMRDGAVKPSEDFTGAIALAVARAAGCHAIVATRTGEGDPNWDAYEQSAYKQALCAHVRERGIVFAIDLHGMVAASEALAAIGSADGRTVAVAPGLDERFADLLRRRLAPWCDRFDKPIVLNGRYAARNPNTIAHAVSRECGIAALQLEVATPLRVPTWRGPRKPKGDPIPFSETQLPVELVARRSADPAAVLALIDALVEGIEQGAGFCSCSE